MAWRDQLRTGSFRGAAFLTEGHDLSGGRRGQVHEFPRRDDPMTEDLGRSARRYTIGCFVLGADYMAARDALISACEAEGPGTLVHPYLGSLTVQLLGFSLSEDADEGGMASFQLSFVEAGVKLSPSIETDTRAMAQLAADAAEASLTDGFAARFNTTMRDFAAAGLAGVVRSAAGTLAGLGAGVLGDAARFELGRATRALTAGASTLISQPGGLASKVMGIASSVRLAAPVADRLRLMTGLSTFGQALDAVPGATLARVVQRANQTALVGLVRQAGAIGAVRSAAESTFATFDDAVRVRGQLSDMLDGLATDAADAGDDNAYGALNDLRRSMVRDLTARGASLARVTSYSPASALPALVLAHRLYGDPTRDQELIDRNGGGNPGFMPQTALQVLIDA